MLWNEDATWLTCIPEDETMFRCGSRLCGVRTSRDVACEIEGSLLPDFSVSLGIPSHKAWRSKTRTTASSKKVLQQETFVSQDFQIQTHSSEHAPPANIQPTQAGHKDPCAGQQKERSFSKNIYQPRIETLILHFLLRHLDGNLRILIQILLR